MTVSIDINASYGISFSNLMQISVPIMASKLLQSLLMSRFQDTNCVAVNVPLKACAIP